MTKACNTSDPHAVAKGWEQTCPIHKRPPFKGIGLEPDWCPSCEADKIVCRAIKTLDSRYVVPDREPGEESYGLLEVLDANGDILANYDIPNGRMFSQLKKKLNIVVEEVEGRG